MAPRKLKDGKDIKMVQRAKNCNKEELANALGDAISSSIPEVPIDSKMNARVASETSDDQESCGSLESSLDSSSRFDPEEFRRALRKKPRRRSRESRLASISPRRKSRKVYPSSSSSELFSSDQEELPRSVVLRRGHLTDLTSRDSQVSTQIVAQEDVPAGGSTQTNRHEQSNKQDHASIVDTRISSQNRIPQSPNTSQNRTHHEHNSAPGTSGTSKQKQSGGMSAGGGRAGSGDGRAGAGGGRAGAGDGRAGAGDGRASAGGGRAGSGDGRAGAEGGVNFDESQLSVRTKIQILKEKLAVLQRTIKFTEVEDFSITSADLDQLSGRASSDGMFVGLLLMAILGPDRLKKMSATGQASRRFAKKLNADGTPAYPEMEAVDKTLMSFFMCILNSNHFVFCFADKVAERNQMRLGPSKIASIRAACTEKKIRGYVTRKLSNHKRPAPQRRQQNEQKLADVE
ncbi:conserved hypothetical protein [Culex quinquefasciatus]|uniref:BEN domain-containing protein n=1 Tax=Culex quinquefasciatus TaxID=7176 RepID=B0XKF1_CULQU|nr:conserved hypothetical protein [Culex quinquefasciatus]|eukprot:XP_001870123.1 conserved hypothetical protein [Culex quinquefasciatus]